MAAEEVARYRNETRGTAERIHFNNAGSSLPPDVVLNTVIDYLVEEATTGGYESEYKYRAQLDDTYQSIARLIGSGSDEIAVVESASVAWGIAFTGIRFQKDDVILTSEMEYVTNWIGLLHAQKAHGVKVQVIPNDKHGNFSLSALESAITPATRLIAVTHIPSTAGGMIPVNEIGKIARAHHVLYLVDACQSVGQMPVDVNAMGCDILSATGRKYLRAPRGTGFLYVRKDIRDTIRPFLMDGFTADNVSESAFSLRNDGRRFELYEKNRALTLGLGKAVDYALAIGVDRIWERVEFLAALLRKTLRALPGVTVHDFGKEQCGIVTFSVSGHHAGAVKQKLFDNNINVSIAIAKSTLVYMNKNKLDGIIRASVHYFNTEEEIARFAEVLETI